MPLTEAGGWQVWVMGAVLVSVLVVLGGKGTGAGAVVIEVVVAVAMSIAVAGGVDTTGGEGAGVQVQTDGQSASPVHDVAVGMHTPGKELVTVQVTVLVAVTVSLGGMSAPALPPGAMLHMPISFGSHQKPVPQSPSALHGTAQ
jgi:hypothetical protein